MEQFTLALTAATWSIASAVGVSALGLTSLRGGNARPRGSIAFGLFALVWGVQIIVINLAGVAGSAQLATKLYLVSLGTLLPLPYFLVEFAAAQSASGPRAFFWRILKATTGTLAITGGFLMIVAPSLLFRGVTPVAGTYYVVWGPLLFPFVNLPLFSAFGIALWSLARTMWRAPTARIARRAGTFVVGLGLYVAFTAANNLTFFVGSIFTDVRPDGLPYTLVFLPLTLVVAAVGIRSLVAMRLAVTADERALERMVALAILLPLAWGTWEGLVAVTVLPQLNTVGLWRLAGVGAMAYGLARWRLFDLPQRLRTTASSATGAAGAAVGGVTAYGVGAALSPGLVLPAAAGLTVFAITLVPGLRLTKRLFGLDQKPNPIDYENLLYEQRIDSYRAAVEASMARGSLDEDETFLYALRERYAITDDEDRVVRYYARNSVIVAREGDLSAAYDRLRILGEGGGGRTWLARDRAGDRLVVIKEPLAHWQRDPKLREAVLKEAQVAAKVRHENVVTVEEVVEHDGMPFIVMEFVDGGSLADLLRAKGQLPWRDAFALTHDILRGLEAVHQRGIVHRDIKPSNILLTTQGRAKIADFGIAVASTSEDGATQIEGEGRAGTLAYMPPEVLDGRSAGGTRADLYACAAVLHECLFGTPVGSDVVVVAENDVPAKVEALLARGLAADPLRRFASARAFADELVKVSKE